LVLRPTKAELYIKQLLEQMGEEFCFQKGFFNQTTHYIVDFYLKRRKKLCLEVDGGYHNTQSQICYDKRRDKFLTEVRGFRVKRISNEQALCMSHSDLARVLS